MGALRREFWILLLIHATNQISGNPVTQYVIPNGQNPARATLPSNTGIPQNSLKNPFKSELTSGPLDSNVLNNLAIALQLLIVSNIMNMPADTDKIKQKFDLPILPAAGISKFDAPKYELSAPSLSLDQALKLYSYEAAKPLYETYNSIPKSSVYYEQPKQSYFERIPNANFLGSSGFSDPVFGSISSVKPNSRSSLTLMSPYDALGTSSFDSLSFPTTYSKKDFQSPYASILAADGSRDLFSVANLF